MTLRPLTLSGWQKKFGEIFNERNQRCDTDDDIMFHLYEHLTKCFESLRKERFDEIAARLPHIFCWLCAFCNRQHIEMTDVVWEKYPNVCPYGLEEQGCVCIAREVAYQPTLPELLRYRNDQTKRQYDVPGIQAMFARIFGPVNSIKPLLAVLSHLLEEVSEVGKDWRKKRMETIDAEVADTFAQLCAVATKLGRNLDDLIWKTYPGVCHKCNREKCAC